MLLLRLRVDSFTLAVIARAVNVNGFPCGTMATRRGEIRSVLNPSRFSACIFRHVFANDFATSPVSSLFANTPAKLMVSGYQNLTNQDKPFGLAPLFPPEMEAKTVQRTTLVLFCSNMADQSDEEYVGVLDGDRRSDTLVPRLTSPSCSTESESEKQRSQWNFIQMESEKEAFRLCERETGWKEVEDWVSVSQHRGGHQWLVF